MGSVSCEVICPVCGMIASEEVWYNSGSACWGCHVCRSSSSKWYPTDERIDLNDPTLHASGMRYEGDRRYGAVEYVHFGKEGTPLSECRAMSKTKREPWQQSMLPVYDVPVCDYSIVDGKLVIYMWKKGYEPRFLFNNKIMTDPDTNKEYLVANEDRFGFGKGVIYPEAVSGSLIEKEFARQKAIYLQFLSKFVDKYGRPIEFTDSDIRCSVWGALRLAEKILAGENIYTEDGCLKYNLYDMIQNNDMHDGAIENSFYNSRHFCVDHFDDICADLSQTVEWLKEVHEKRNANKVPVDNYSEYDKKIRAEFEAEAYKLPNIPEIRAGHPYLEIVRLYKEDKDDDGTLKYKCSEKFASDAFKEHQRDLYDHLKYAHGDLDMETMIAFYEEEKKRREEAEKEYIERERRRQEEIDNFKAFCEREAGFFYVNKLSYEDYSNIRAGAHQENEDDLPLPSYSMSEPIYRRWEPVCIEDGQVIINDGHHGQERMF